MPVLNIELLDQKAQNTESGFLYEQAPINTRIPNLFKAAFPMTDPKVPKLFFKIKSSNSEKLDLAIEKFLGTFVIFLGDKYDDLSEIIRSTRIQVGHVDNNCIVMIPLDSHEAYTSLAQGVESALMILDDTGIRATGVLGLGISIKDVLSYVDRKTMKDIKDPKKLKELNEKTNLFKLITHGLALKVKLDIAKKYLKDLRTKIIGGMKKLVDQLFPDKVFNFCLKAIKGIHVRLKLSPEETYGLFKNSVGELELPDAADLIDEIGMFLHDQKLINMYDNIPFVKEVIDSFHDLAKCDIEAGYCSLQRTASLNFYTEGIKELFDNIMQGFS